MGSRRDPRSRAVAGGTIDVVIAEWGLLEWTFAIILVGLAGAVGAVFLFLVGTLFVNPGRRKRST